MVISCKVSRFDDGVSVWEFVVLFEMDFEELDAKKLLMSLTKLEKDPNDTFPFSTKEGGFVKLLVLLLLLLMLLEVLLMLVLFLILLGESS
jgi:hypothetical protein